MSDDDWSERFMSLGAAGEREKRRYLAQKNGMAFADLDRVLIDPQTAALIPADLARELRTLPVKREGSTLWVAFDAPSDEAIRRVKEATGLRAIPVMCVPAALDDALARL